jgi:hypothetical protein
MSNASEDVPSDPIAEAVANHFPNPQEIDVEKLLDGLQTTLRAVQVAGQTIDRLLWGLFVLACVCVGQLLALAMR